MEIIILDSSHIGRSVLLYCKFSKRFQGERKENSSFELVSLSSVFFQTDAYQATGCYNLLCSGFVQTNNKIAIGAAISPRSYYNGRQFDVGLMIWKVSFLQYPMNPPGQMKKKKRKNEKKERKDGAIAK